MATLRAFQSEIEDIQTKSAEQQRIAAAASAALADKKLKPKEPVDQAAKDTPMSPVTDNDDEEDLAQVQDLLLGDEASHRRVSDLIASIVTRKRGECLVHLGLHPPHQLLFGNSPLPTEPTDDAAAKEAEWRGSKLDAEQLKTAIATLTQIVDGLGATVTRLFEHPTRATCLVRIPPPTVELTPEVRCAVVGNVDSGKSTTLGVLTRGALDDGRGKARVGLFRHKHEIETGRTSSVGMEILGFGPSGLPILPAIAAAPDSEVVKRERLGWEDIAAQSSKIISFIDLAGHERYLKTTLYGLTSGAPSCVFLMVGANAAGLIGMSKEHLAISLALSVPVVICITKIDMTPTNVLNETIKHIVKVLKSPGCRKTPVFVQSVESAAELSQVFVGKRLCPIFQISNVTGQGLDHVRTFLNLLPSSENEKKFIKDQPLEYSVTEVWSVPYTGVVVNGIINSGTITAGDPVLIGPDSLGGWISTAVKSIHRKRAPVPSAEAGQSVSFALKKMKKGVVRKGMVVIAKTETPPKVTRRFEGQVLILYHNTTLQRNYQAMLHCGNIRQTVRLVDMDSEQGILRTGDRATVIFEFIQRPEFLKPGMKLLFREGSTKGLGVVTKLL
ncbi:probable GTP-binding protein 1 [Serendipita indica DSM 11827]|uniref:Probable GTP-binding protein 1 n=1 Tax=Serendipita indica (strain DSM 11827) TaxID=1109443 RepID=G4TB26_SERID|nr:probable GTP-binding protein 1 [Serendipita indica DSM 11827]